MTISELKEKIKDLPDDMKVQLLDYTTDDTWDSAYPIPLEHVSVGDYTNAEEEIAGQLLWIGFENKLNDNPI